MKPYSLRLIAISMLCSLCAWGQVDEIKRASSAHGSESGGSSSRGGSSDDDAVLNVVGTLLFTDAFGVLATGVVRAQEHRLRKEFDSQIPTITSFEILLQGAVQPSSYYIVNPRLRANWGIFSTDFRMNYLLEETLDGVKHIRTTDWQILQLNVIGTRHITARFGGGILYEAFSGSKQFAEWTAGVHFQTLSQRIGAMTEFRWSEPRDEWNGHLQYRLFQQRHFQVYATAGGVFQRYYRAINVWGMQGGLMLRFL